MVDMLPLVQGSNPWTSIEMTFLDIIEFKNKTVIIYSIGG